MGELKKATLQEIKSDESAAPLGEPIPVQFNPTTLKLQISNSVEGGETLGRQSRQYLGSSSTVLTLDLTFDTADEGTTDSPRSVREKTALVEKFVLPVGQGEEKQAPPKLRFQWGNLIIDGVIDSVSIDFDLFAADGTPLRAKVGLAIKEQDSKYQFLSAGPGANGAGNVAAPGRTSLAIPGGLSLGLSAQFGFSAQLGLSVGLGASAQFGVAIGGESAAEFAARVGLDPSAWRGLSIGASSSLSLEAGLEVGFNPGLGASAGLGVSVGVESGISASMEESLGLAASGASSGIASGFSGGGASASVAAGYSLAAAGGVSAAIESVQITKSQAAEQKAREAFGVPAPVQSVAVSSAVVTPAQQERQPLVTTGASSISQQQAALPAPAPPRADRRAATFGFGVPLRPAVGQASDQRASSIQGSAPLRSQVKSSGGPPTSDDPTTPPWVSLAARDLTRSTVDKTQARVRPSRPCGCSGRCRH